MKVIIAGSRHITDAEALETTIGDTGWDIDEVVSGTCRGVDCMGEEWAKANGIAVRQFPADWAAYGRIAGELRNRDMAHYADGLILLWDGKSPGATCMLRESNKAGIKVHQQIYGWDMNALEATEQAILEHYWNHQGRLVNTDGNWHWDDLTPEAPLVNAHAVQSLINRGLMNEAVMKILEPAKEA